MAAEVTRLEVQRYVAHVCITVGTLSKRVFNAPGLLPRWMKDRELCLKANNMEKLRKALDDYPHCVPPAAEVTKHHFRRIQPNTEMRFDRTDNASNVDRIRKARGGAGMHLDANLDNPINKSSETPGPSPSTMDQENTSKARLMQKEAMARRIPFSQFLARCAERGWDEMVKAGEVQS